MTYKGLLDINLKGIEKDTKYLPLGANLWAVRFESRFCVTVKIMKLMGAWKSSIFYCCIDEVETNIHVIKCDHPYMTRALENKIN